MKKILLTAMVAVASLTANAQVWLGGSIGLGFHNYDDGDKYKTTIFEISPEVGYSLSENWDIALAVNLNFSNYKPDGADKVNTNEWSISPYVRYSFFKNGAISFFVDGVFEVGTTNRYLTEDFGNLGVQTKCDDKGTVWRIGIRPGVKFAASEKVSLVATVGSLGYRHYKQGDEKVNDFGFGVDGNALKFGVYYTF